MLIVIFAKIFRAIAIYFLRAIPKIRHFQDILTVQGARYPEKLKRMAGR
jgi:hypothetical protein